jgi:hypothetical protein
MIVVIRNEKEGFMNKLMLRNFKVYSLSLGRGFRVRGHRSSFPSPDPT